MDNTVANILSYENVSHIVYMTLELPFILYTALVNHAITYIIYDENSYSVGAQIRCLGL